MAIEDRGFASMDRARHKEIASKGGLAAHAQGKAHTWTPDEAKEAGRRGGRRRACNKQGHAAPDADGRCSRCGADPAKAAP